jgi:uncharacterized protein (TIRG00374 family)
MSRTDADSPQERGDWDEEEVAPGAEGDEAEPSFLQDPKRLAQTGLLVLIMIAGVYLVLPEIVGVEDGLRVLKRADPVWVGVALGFGVLMFFSYVGLFKGVVGEQLVDLNWRESYQITMAGLAATRLFSAGGAGGIVLTYWALRKAGMPRQQSACRMVAFLVLLYAVYMLTLVIDGILLRTGVLAGPAPAGLTIVPAAIAGGVIALFLLIALIPGDFQRRLSEASPESRLGRIGVRLATVPATLASGTRLAIAFVAQPSRGGLAVLGAIGFWASNIAILWASFQAFDVSVSGAVVVQGFFVGMLANLIPSPSGVGPVDAGMIGTFVLFGLPSGPVIAAVLVYRVIAFWLPLPPGIVAFFQLRKTAQRWEDERGARAEQTALQKVKYPLDKPGNESHAAETDRMRSA